MKFTIGQRQHLASMLSNSANVVLVALVVGQFVENRVQWGLVIAGLFIYAILAVISTNLQNEQEMKKG
jgi:hypothetical protein